MHDRLTTSTELPATHPAHPYEGIIRGQKKRAATGWGWFTCGLATSLLGATLLSGAQQGAHAETPLAYPDRLMAEATTPQEPAAGAPAPAGGEAAPSTVTLSDAEARQFVVDFTTRTITLLDNRQLSPEEQNRELIHLFNEVVDTQWIAKFVLGKYWRTITTQERILFHQLYRDYLIRRYLPSFRMHTEEKLAKITQVMLKGSSAFVTTDIIRKEGPPIALAYRIRKKADDTVRVYDIIAEGVSMLTTHRSEFGSVISHHGFDYLLKQMQDQTPANKPLVSTTAP